MSQQTTGKSVSGQIADTIALRMLKRPALVVLLSVATIAACTDNPTAPTVTTPPPFPTVNVPLPTTVPGVLGLRMPIDASDAATTAFGLAPFGYHGADHAADGHPGWDVEYRIGGIVRSAAAGTVQSVFADPSVPGRSTVQIEHVVGTHFYRTVYTNLATVSPGIAADAAVLALPVPVDARRDRPGAAAGGCAGSAEFAPAPRVGRAAASVGPKLEVP